MTVNSQPLEDTGLREPRILVVAEHASARFGGEAALPLHYFRVLRQRRVPVWLLSHARTRGELTAVFGSAQEIHYIEDTWFHKLMWRIGTWMPARVSYLTVEFASRLTVQVAQRRMIRRLVARHAINLIHQPMPVSPREPSMMFGFGVPVVIGPMNGGLDYPPAFRKARGGLEQFLMSVGRANARWLNRLMPGKQRAAALIVANELTFRALPKGICGNVFRLVENGVDMQVWRGGSSPTVICTDSTPTFIFMGRLVDWKSVDLLLYAFAAARAKNPMRLWIVGDGLERTSLQTLADQLDIRSDDSQSVGSVSFAGWLSQADCAQLVRRAHCLVLPSVLECGGAVVLEAMAMGKPVIATAWGGPLDYLDKTCGILVPPDSREELISGIAAAMVTLAADAGLREEMGRCGASKVARDFDWERKVDRMLEIYSSVLAR